MFFNSSQTWRLAGCKGFPCCRFTEWLCFLCCSQRNVIVAHGEMLLTLIYQNWVLYETLNQTAFSELVNTFIKTKRLVTHCALSGLIHINHENNILINLGLGVLFYFSLFVLFWNLYYETNRTPDLSNVTSWNNLSWSHLLHGGRCILDSSL